MVSWYVARVFSKSLWNYYRYYYNSYYYYYYYYYYLKLSCHSVALVLTLVQTKHKRNNTKNTVQTIQNKINTSTHITKTSTRTQTHTLQNKLQQTQYTLQQIQHKTYPNESHNIIKYPQYKVTLINMFYMYTYKIPYEIWGSLESVGGHSILWYLLGTCAIIRTG